LLTYNIPYSVIAKYEATIYFIKGHVIMVVLSALV